MAQAWAGNIFLGSGKSVVARQAENQLKNLPQEQLTHLKNHYGDPLNMDLFYRNNVGIHELGHLYQFIEVSKGQRRWLQEVFATYAARSYLVKFQPKLAAATLAYVEIGTEAHEHHIKYRSLKAFEELFIEGLGPQNYEWFQFQLFKKVVVLHEKFGIEGLVKLRNFLVATDLTVEKRLDD